ncbi:MAG: DUF2442 domain-containing protein [Betaproteobacteria bacterium]|nr:DUF2442 domain-containing protein [Betaproteobacteria bacterium]
MSMTETEFTQAQTRATTRRKAGYAVKARFDRRTARVVVSLDSGVHITFPVELAEGLSGALPEELAIIEITPGGMGLHWPKLDADVYVPALLQGVFGSKKWMAARLGAAGGKVRSESKAAASRENGRKGGRPRRIASSC